MKVIIAGSRSIHDLHHVECAIRLSGFEITEVVSGGAAGVDSLGEEWALQHGVPIKGFSVESWEWDRGRDAGVKRNARMADYADAAVIVWDGKSSGTKNMIDQMRARGKLVYVYIVQ